MEPQTPVAPDLPIAELVRTALTRPGSPFTTAPARWLLVDADRQRLLLMHGSEPAEDFAISTAANGIGGESGSYRTPPGWHKIHRRIGAGQPNGAVFVSREPTGAVWGGEPGPDDLILTRVLTLDGLEPGVNQGPGRDSLERYIYIHGTNHENELGLRASHGCVRMANADVVRLHDLVEAGDPVVIVGGQDAPGSVADSADDAPAIPDPAGPGRFHYAGLGGSGMSALAQFQVMSGGRASGSDRAFDRGERAPRPRSRRSGSRSSRRTEAGSQAVPRWWCRPRSRTACPTSRARSRSGFRSSIVPSCSRTTSIVGGRSRSPAPAANPRSRRWCSRSCAAPVATPRSSPAATWSYSRTTA
jgi:hypothetical protein